MHPSLVRGSILVPLVVVALQPWHLAGAQSTTGTPATPLPASCASAEYRQFDFRVGDWQVSTPDGRPAGHNRIERVLGGCALQEHWTGAGGGGGTSLNFFDSASGQWHQVWIDVSGQVLRLAGTAGDGRMVLEGTTTRADGKPVRQRITWTAGTDGRVRQLWESAADGGTWLVLFDGSYARSRRSPTDKPES